MTTTAEQKNEAIHRVLLAILKRDGEIKPDRVIEEAKKPDSPLHDRFEWNVEKAALETWRAQARDIISSFSVTLIVNRTEYNISEFVENPIKAPNEQGYVSFEMVSSNKQMTRRFMDKELAIASTYVEKSKTYAEVLGLGQKVEGLLSKIASVRKKVAKS